MDKISFMGDLMFEQQYIKSRKMNDGNYDFSGLLVHLRPLLQESDYVVANLETVFGGGELGYTSNLYSFNTPDEAGSVLKECGINLVSTANNHCLDRGVMGLVRTLKILDELGVEHTGTYGDEMLKPHSIIKEINGTRYAFMSYTYGTNTLENKVYLTEKEKGCVNLLKPQGCDNLKLQGENRSAIVRFLTTCSQKLFTTEMRMSIKKLLGMPLNVPIVDDNIVIDSGYAEALVRDIHGVLQCADVVFMCLHSGGQFNASPGQFTRDIVKMISNAGIPYIVATHPHVVQRFDSLGENKNVFYSLGSLSLSPSSDYVLHELKPEYSIIPHYYFDCISGKKRLAKLTYSVVKVVESPDYNLTVFPVTQLFDLLEGAERNQLVSDVEFICRRVTNQTVSSINILDEYEIKL